MRKLVVWSAGVCVCALAVGLGLGAADGEHPDLKISIAMPEHNVINAQPGHFYVVIENVSDKPQGIYDEWNSWGWFSVSFEYTDTTPTGKKILMRRDPAQAAWFMNFPSFTTLSPGQVMVRQIELDNPWLNIPVKAHGDYEVRIHAIFAQHKPFVQGKTNSVVWHGTITSPDVDIIFRSP